MLVFMVFILKFLFKTTSFYRIVSLCIILQDEISFILKPLAVDRFSSWYEKKKKIQNFSDL
jgi:hypothetical protein